MTRYCLIYTKVTYIQRTGAQHLRWPKSGGERASPAEVESAKLAQVDKLSNSRLLLLGGDRRPLPNRAVLFALLGFPATHGIF